MAIEQGIDARKKAQEAPAANQQIAPFNLYDPLISGSSARLPDEKSQAWRHWRKFMRGA
jgi:hypothetical protein